VALKLVFARRGKPAVTNAGSIQTDTQQQYRCTEDKQSAPFVPSHHHSVGIDTETFAWPR
jgi:hypothetical protein